MVSTIWGNFVSAQKWRWLGLMALAFGLIATITYSFAYRIYAEEAQNQAHSQAENGRSTLLSISQQHTPLLYGLSLSEHISATLSGEDATILNQHLLEIKQRAQLESIYLMNTNGLTLAASNYLEKVNYLGKNYSFRPYFKHAMAGNNSDFFAIGATTGKPGYFVSQPVFNQVGDVIGVLAAKVSVSSFHLLWPNDNIHGFVTNKNQVIILASNNQWLYQTLQPLSQSQRDNIKAQRQFADLSLPVLAWQPQDSGQTGIGNKQFLYANTTTLDNGWQLHMLVDTNSVKARSLYVALLISTAIFFLWAWALVIRSKRLKQALHNSEQNRQELVNVNQQMQVEISERIEAEAKLEQAQNKLVQSSRMAALGQLSASVIHELGQPLTALRTYIAAAELDAPTPAMSALLSNLHRVIQRMQITTDELRLFSRPGNLKMEPVDLNQTIQKTVDMMHQSVADSSNKPTCHMQLSPSQSSAMVLGHEHRLEQVISNLLSNAFAAVEEVSAPSIILSLAKQQSLWVITVSDNGPGFGNKQPEHLFEAFYTTKADKQGMGLGLAISAAIVDEHHGKIWAAHNQHGGADFSFSLPQLNSEFDHD